MLVPSMAGCLDPKIRGSVIHYAQEISTLIAGIVGSQQVALCACQGLLQTINRQQETQPCSKDVFCLRVVSAITE